MPYTTGLISVDVVTFSVNPEVAGKELDEIKTIIVDAYRPIIRKNGQIVQTAHVIIEERPLSDSEIATKIEQEKSMRQRLEEKTPESAPEIPKPVSQAQEQVKPTPPIPQTVTKQPRITRAQNKVQEDLLEEYKRKNDCL